MSRARVRVNGVQLEYAEEGAGVPVVFSHGGSSDLRYWEPQRPAFAARYRFVAYSQRFHGAGPWPAEGDYSASAHAADLVAIMRRLGVGPVHLVGFSRTTALHAALREPGLVRSLTVLEPNVPWILEGAPGGEALRRMWLGNFGTRPPAAPAEPLTCGQLGAVAAPTLAVAAEYGMSYPRRS